MGHGSPCEEQAALLAGAAEDRAREAGRTEVNALPRRAPPGRTCLFLKHAQVAPCCGPGTGLGNGVNSDRAADEILVLRMRCYMAEGP